MLRTKRTSNIDDTSESAGGTSSKSQAKRRKSWRLTGADQNTTDHMSLTIDTTAREEAENDSTTPATSWAMMEDLTGDRTPTGRPASPVHSQTDGENGDVESGPDFESAADSEAAADFETDAVGLHFVLNGTFEEGLRASLTFSPADRIPSGIRSRIEERIATVCAKCSSYEGEDRDDLKNPWEEITTRLGNTCIDVLVDEDASEIELECSFEAGNVFDGNFSLWAASALAVAADAV